jgi:hypothetical protein
MWIGIWTGFQYAQNSIPLSSFPRMINNIPGGYSPGDWQQIAW